ncbi:phosphoserine phosphatase [Okibacterium sp. HSC-33S16]|uniref:phosphoserine phosphatase SerB n=1 Tax=Okibacterium sp. HSC-33S16 TaxID=2910965 RepID=UPI0020A220DD|nr:phosphoserine phosphatase SerB [Okibacterium sp. HSC-33S16]MCP2030935.1 phosphoserine phosphatase [Okibacterium sp. HSC-33S16]
MSVFSTPDASQPARFLVVLDADSTLIQNEAIELLAEEAGSLDHVAAVTERAMRGELDFAASLRERVATLAGLEGLVFDVVRSRITVTPGVQELIAGLHDRGSRVGVVSGGFHELLDPLGAALGLDHLRANRLEVVDGRLTGRVLGPIVDAQAKADALTQWAAENEVPLRQTIAVGDGANDLLMMGVAGLSVAFNAKPAVRERADVTAGRIDLSDVLPLIGLRG